MEAIGKMIEKTIKEYAENVYRTVTTAEVTELSKDKKGYVTVAADRTIFHPLQGGQSADTGYIEPLDSLRAGGADPAGVRDSTETVSAGQPRALRYEVTAVAERDGVVVHTLSVKDAPALSAGTRIRMTIDWDHRFDNMQRHCGEHILSGALHRLYGGVNHGFHMGEDCMTIDISLEDDPEYSGRPLTFEMVEAAEYEANKVIWRDEPVSVTFFPTHDEALKMPLRKELTIDRDITVVTVGDLSDPSDCVACCGTHPSSAGQVGLIKVFRVMYNKGMYRIFFEAGQRAYLACRDDYDTLMHIAQDLSAGRQDAAQKYDAQKAKNSDARERLFNIVGMIKKKETGELAEALASGTPVIRYYDLLKPDEISDIGLSLLGKIPSLLVLITSSENAVLLFSDTADCGMIVKQYAPLNGGKGGGKKDFARAVFPSSAEAKAFAGSLAE